MSSQVSLYDDKTFSPLVFNLIIIMDSNCEYSMGCLLKNITLVCHIIFSYLKLNKSVS